MTRAAVQGYISRATRALAAGDCEYAAQEVTAGLSALNDYASMVAHHGGSPAVPLKLQKALSKLHVKARNACAAPMHPDALLAPSFSGAGLPALTGGYSRMMPFIGFALATIGLGVGIGTLYKSWG